MTGGTALMGVLLLAALTGVCCEKEAVFLYSRLGGDALLPCSAPVSPDCSSISWTFFKGNGVHYTLEVSRGQVSTNSDKSSRTSITSNCSLSLRRLRVDDAGSYVCLKHEKAVTNVYLSLLTITSLSSVTELQPGGSLVLSCILFTYFDAGSCKYSNVFSLRWLAEDETELRTDGRFELVDQTRCNITLITKLQQEDNNRKWRCQVKTSESSRAAFLDFKSTFLFENTPTGLNVDPSVTTECPVSLPISRIVLCVALPVMVVAVGFFTWKLDHKKAEMSAAVIELQEVN